MEPQEVYFIRNVGCDDETSGIFHLSEDELEFLLTVFYNLNKNSEYCCMPRIFIAKVREDKFIQLITSKEIDLANSHDVFYDQFGNAFTWAEGCGVSDLSWISYKQWLDNKSKEENNE